MWIAIPSQMRNSDLFNDSWMTLVFWVSGERRIHYENLGMTENLL